MSRTFVIAEAAACHDGDYEQAQRLIELGASIGANAVKFQYCSNPKKLAELRHAPEYLESYQLLKMPRGWLEGLANFCQIWSVEFMCTVYLPEDIEVIAPYVKRFKVASFEAWDEEFVHAHEKWCNEKSIIISSGLNHYPLVEYYDNLDIDWLHCVSAYPTPLNEINLGAIREDPEWHYAGLSDHTKHPWTGGLAVAAGAQIIEFHMRLHDTSPTNADYEVSRDPEEAREYVANIRLAEQMLGDGVKRVMPSEEKMLKYRVKG